MEFGSPKETLLPEALALYYADELIKFIEESKEATEDDFMYNYQRGLVFFLDDNKTNLL